MSEQFETYMDDTVELHEQIISMMAVLTPIQKMTLLGTVTVDSLTSIDRDGFTAYFPTLDNGIVEVEVKVREHNVDAKH